MKAKVIVGAIVVVIGIVLGAMNFMESNVEYADFAAAEQSHKKVQVKGEWVTSDWFWVTTLGLAEATTRAIWEMGHRRWEIENQGFNYLTTHCHLNHNFHHDLGAILAFVLTNLIAYVLTSAFYQFNLKPQARKDCCLTSLIWIFWMTLDELLTACARMRAVRGP